MNESSAKIEMRDLTLAYGDKVILHDVNAVVHPAEIFVIMGPSGCGKSTLLRHLIGLMCPAAGQVIYDGEDFWAGSEEQRQVRLRRFGVLFQSGALWSSMTLLENVGLPLGEYTSLSQPEIDGLARFKLSLVGLRGFEDYYPAEISGGMRKRAGLARAMALDPEILFFDEPSAGLDPISSYRLDQLILQLRDGLKTTVVMVTHELDSIFAIADRAIYLDPESRTVRAEGNPRTLLKETQDPVVRDFLTRGQKESIQR